MRRHLSPYKPLTLRRRGLDLQPFRMVILNWVGWSVLFGATAVVGVGAGMLSGRFLVALLAGVLVPVSAVVADRQRWRNSGLSLRVESAEQAQQLVEVLAAEGIEARTESWRWDDEQEVEHVDHSVIVRQRDDKAVSAAHQQLGIR